MSVSLLGTFQGQYVAEVYGRVLLFTDAHLVNGYAEITAPWNATGDGDVNGWRADESDINSLTRDIQARAHSGELDACRNCREQPATEGERCPACCSAATGSHLDDRQDY